MSCLYCQESTGRDRAAVAVCTDCGSAVCRDHAVIRSHRTTHVVGPVKGWRAELPGWFAAQAAMPPRATDSCVVCK